MIAALSLTGVVFGIGQTLVQPPATAAAQPDSDRLLMLLPRLAQMHVHVDKARSDEQPARVKDLTVLRLSSSGPIHAATLPSSMRMSCPLFSGVGRIDEMAVCDE